MTDNLELEKLKLKVQALNERIAELTTDAENKIADLRVDLTLLSQQNSQLREALEAHQQQEQFVDQDVLEGEVVDG